MMCSPWRLLAAFIVIFSVMFGTLWTASNGDVICHIPLLRGVAFCTVHRYDGPLKQDARVVQRQNVTASAKKVLIYSPTFGHWHSTFMSRIADVLVEDGYNVTFLVPKMDVSIKADPKLATIITLPTHPETAAILSRGADFGLRRLWYDLSPLAALGTRLDRRAQNFSTMFDYECEYTLAHSQLHNSLQAENYDLAITELFDLCGLGLFHHLQIKRIALMSTSPLHEFFGQMLGLPGLTGMTISAMASKVPAKYGDEWTWRNRIANAAASSGVAAMMFGALLPKQEALFRALDHDFPGMAALMRRSAMMFLNNHPAVYFNEPTLPNFVPIGGIATGRARPLPKKWDEIFTRRSHTVLVSFGTVFKAVTMPEEYMEGLLRVFHELPQVTFIFKHEKASVLRERLPPNVVVRSWLPQRDLLADPRLHLFVTHGGIGSTMEAATGGCPTLMIPVMFDQPRNALMMARHGCSRMLRKAEAFTRPLLLVEAIQDMLDNSSYAKNARSLSEEIKQSGDPTKLFLEKIRYIVSRPETRSWRSFDGLSPTMSWWAVYNYDLLLVSLTFPVAIVTFILFFCRCS